ncbi:apolipoprotein N-acyltransferase [Sunxiuqinia sp. A32]|uniref:apolipoprotein N-acyltransferase n=1 Tax=Sunxiuqinia sp. A32 TaxID=3461496 RepID=UPI00404551B7
MKKYQLVLLSLFSGLLLSLPWLGILPGWILFIALLPLLLVEEELFRKRTSNHHIEFSAYGFLAFLSWNMLTTWWIMHATIFGMIIIVLLNSVLMTVVWWLYHLFKRNVSARLGELALVVLWLSFEYIHFNWEIAWPWLTLGNGFANQVTLVQWYEYTGVLGGSLWILMINLILFKIFNRSSFEVIKGYSLKLFILLFVVFTPISFSFYQYRNYQETGETREVVILQPNIDPYNEKFGGLSEKEQVDRLLQLANSLVTDSTKFLIGPETAIPPVWENEEIGNNPYILPFKSLVRQYPSLQIVFGATTQKLYYPGKEMPETVRRMKNSDLYFDIYNSAILIDRSDEIQYYHKSILVSGVEKMPFSKYFSFVEKFIIDLGGTTGSLGVQNEPSVFESDDGVLVAPVICYESVFGEYLTQFVKKGANLIFIITNDGWWLDSPGYKQHFSFSRLRAVETRRSIVRAANTGISAIINQRGDVEINTNWWEISAIKWDVKANAEETFYVRYGDYIGRISVLIASLLLIYLFVQANIYKKEKIRTNPFVQNP